MSNQRSEMLSDVARMAIEQTQWMASTVDDGIQFTRPDDPAKRVLWLPSEAELNQLMLDLQSSAQDAFGAGATGAQLLSVWVLEALETAKVDEGILRRSGSGLVVDPTR